MFEPAPPRPHLLEMGVCADVYAPVLTSGSGVVCVETRHMQAVLKVQINNGPQRCTRYRANDASGALSSGPATQSETTNAADSSQTASVEGHCLSPLSFHHNVLAAALANKLARIAATHGCALPAHGPPLSKNWPTTGAGWTIGLMR